MNIRSLTRGDGAVIGAAVLLLIASFLPFFSIDQVNKSVSSWSPALFPLLPVVTLGALASAAAVLVGRNQPAEKKLIGLTLQQWSTALAVVVGWAALWSMFATAIPDVGQGGANDGVSKGAGAWLTLIFGLALAAAAVLSDRVPALQAPLLGAPKPAQPYGGPAGGQPYGVAPQQAGYGYPGGAQSVDPAFAQGGHQAAPYGGAPQPAATAPAPSADFTAFWFAVPVPRPLYSEDGAGGQIAELTPGTWYLAVDQRGQALVAQTQDGRRGVLQDSSGIQRG
ncbi:DUF5336 domain-containing protein [Actinacidiphila rubida]|uniref:Uncharacterized protein n=1 Tax=Actinacidiphila rubida TaxID=310780 RepID=A0A1H8FEZ1_9ACTN|nr:DUF5336 domain-containing protein [Actinacidiphila rubida]SEN30160.1 hypothetical protein SAMN05216267_1003280 [Actinacidiphila rubida]